MMGGTRARLQPCHRSGGEPSLSTAEFATESRRACPELVWDVFLQNSHKIVILSGAPHRFIA
jgi:hypothetical protein